MELSYGHGKYVKTIFIAYHHEKMSIKEETFKKNVVISFTADSNHRIAFIQPTSMWKLVSDHLISWKVMWQYVLIKDHRTGNDLCQNEPFAGVSADKLISLSIFLNKGIAQ